MTLIQIAFLTLLGSAYLTFIVVLAWATHITKDIGKERFAANKAGVQPNPPDGPQQRAPRLDHAA